jgi:hypothetical protein
LLSILMMIVCVAVPRRGGRALSICCCCWCDLSFSLILFLVVNCTVLGLAGNAIVAVAVVCLFLARRDALGAQRVLFFLLLCFSASPFNK